MIRPCSANWAVEGTSARQTDSAAELPSVSTKCAASSRTKAEIGQPRPPREVQGNAAMTPPFVNSISSSLVDGAASTSLLDPYEPTG